MKRCPTCTRTFLDEHLSYCTDDGTPLVDQPVASSFDPQATILTPSEPSTNEVRSPPPTRPFRQDEMPGGWPQPHAWADPSPPAAPISPPSWSAPPQVAQPWSPPPPPGMPYYAKKSQQNPVAIAALAAGVFSITLGLCCYVGAGTGPIAIILGIVALSQIKNNEYQASSKGMAIAGIATGAAAAAIIFMFLVLGIALR